MYSIIHLLSCGTNYIIATLVVSFFVLKFVIIFFHFLCDKLEVVVIMGSIIWAMGESLPTKQREWMWQTNVSLQTSMNKKDDGFNQCLFYYQYYIWDLCNDGFTIFNFKISLSKCYQPTQLSFPNQFLGYLFQLKPMIIPKEQGT